jgi:hypothetical protein
MAQADRDVLTRRPPIDVRHRLCVIRELRSSGILSVMRKYAFIYCDAAVLDIG